jgi:hypothetical protein
MTNHYDDEVTRYERALAALREAARVCAECGVDLPLGSVADINGQSSVVATAVAVAERALESARRRSQPIALGDAVLVIDPYSRRTESKRQRVVKIGRSFVTLDDGAAYDINGGHTRGIGSGTIHPDDLARINRDLVRGVVAVTRAETLRDVAQELQRFGTDTERAAAGDAREARLALAHSFRSVPAALSLTLVDEREKALRELRAAETLPPDDPDRRVMYGPCPLGSLAKRAREGGIEVTHEKETDR